MGSIFGGGGGASSDQQPEKASEVVVTPAPKLTKENYKELGQKMVEEFVLQSNAGREEGWEVDIPLSPDNIICCL